MYVKELGGKCNMHMRNEKLVRRFSWKNRRKDISVED